MLIVYADDSIRGDNSRICELEEIMHSKTIRVPTLGVSKAHIGANCSCRHGILMYAWQV